MRDWCRNFGPVLAYLPNMPNILIVQVDGDVRGQVSASTNEKLCDEVKSWLGPGVTFPGLVIAIPTEATETWLLAANRPANPALERVKKPAEQLIRAKLIEHDAHGNPIKDYARYRELAAPLGEQLSALRRVLTELDRFCVKVEAVRSRVIAN